MTGPELISRGTRREIRDMMSGTVLREINAMWEDEGFPAAAETDPVVGGERVSRFQNHLNSVDWSDPGHVGRALRVFEVALHGYERQYLTKVIRKLDQDGYTLDENGKINGSRIVVVREGVLAGLTDPSAIREHLDRIARAIEDDDAAQAIGSAKELIESTAKVVLHERGLPVNDRDDLPELVRAAQVALGATQPVSPPGPTAQMPSKRSSAAPPPWRRAWPSFATVAMARVMAEVRNVWAFGLDMLVWRWAEPKCGASSCSTH